MSEEYTESGDQTGDAVPVDNANYENESYVQHQESRQVPLDALQAERAERQKLQDEMRMLKDNLSLMQSNQMRQQQPQQKDELDGLSDDDVLTVGEAKKFIGKMNSQYQTNISELRMTQKYPDYQQVITRYLPDVIKTNPSLRDSLEKTQDYELAYYLAKNSEGFKADNRKTKKNVDAERIVQNASQGGSLSSVGQTSPISHAKKYSAMSDSDFKKEMNKNLGYF